MLILFVFLLLGKGVQCLKIISVDVPSHVQIGQTAVMQCIYELGTDDLYSVKWYKEKHEFYRYVPKDQPPGQVFELNGIRVNGPVIEGGQNHYRVGDSVHMNCSALASSPAVTLQWFVNGKKAMDSVLHRYPIIRNGNGLESKILGLEFQVSDQHFVDGGLHLRCESSFHPFYNISSEHSINQKHQPLSVLQNNDILSQVQSKQISRHFHSSFLIPIMSCIYYLLR
uniref:Ig-like domain-containing protein n=1 Tax=Strigamia maritima TaxID=126957 RepID=T1JDL3_STRMM